MNLGVNSMSLTTSNASRKSGDEVPGQFPAGLRVLVVDDDPTCLRILEKMLRNCHYEVTKCSRAVVALKSLRENRDGFDIVISDVHMPDMDGFKLLEHVGLEMDLPVIMMSADDSKHVVMKGVTHGACDYLIKPVRMEALKNIWQHVVRKKRHEWKEKDLEQSGSVEDGERQQKPYDDAEYSSSANEGNWKSSKRRKDEEDEGEDKDDPSTLKKPRVVWSVELHQQFVSAVNQLGIDKAVPKKILELMNVPGLTRENVASHLQKYRLYLRRLSGQPQNGIVNSFMGPQDSGFGPLSGLDHLQALGQIPSQSLATIQAAAVSRKSFAEQRNIFSFENPHIRFAEGQQQQHNNGKQVNLLHGIPTTMDSKQLAALHQSLQPFGNVHSHSGKTNSPLTQQSRTRMLNEVGSTSVLNLPSTVGQAIPGAVFSPYQIDNARAPTYTSLSSPSSVVTMDFPRDTIPLASNSELNSSGCRSFVPNFDVFNDLNQNRTEDWGIGSTPQQSVLVQPAGLTSVTVNTATAFSATSGFGSTTSSNAAADHNSLRIKEERLPEMGLQDTLFGDHDFSQEDLIMTALFKQQQQQQQLEGVENEFALDEYQLDNLPV